MEEEPMTTTTAAILSCEPTTLAFDDGQRLACLYVTVDGRTDPRIVDLLAGCHAGCDQGELDWQLVNRPRSVLLGIELAHTCADPDVAGLRLRLVFDIRRDVEALQHLSTTEALVVGTRAYGSFANTVGAFGVDGAAVRRAVDAASAELERVGAVACTA